jgi:hypothetical protein
MFSTRCNNCHQLINLKTEELKDAIDYAEAQGEKIYAMKCPHCRKPIKLQVAQLKLKMPRTLPESLQPHEQETNEENAAQ